MTCKEWAQFWDTIAFYSYIQSPDINKPRQGLNENLFTEAYEPFIEVWQELKPDVVVFYSRRAFASMGSKLSQDPATAFGSHGPWWAQVGKAGEDFVYRIVASVHQTF